MRISLIFPCILLAACSSSSSSSTPTNDAATDAPIDDTQIDDTAAEADTTPPIPYPADHPPAPQVLTGKGPVIASPKIVPIVFKSDPLAGDIATYVQQLVAAKDYWKGATAEYGVGALSAVDVITFDETPTTTLDDTDVQTWLTAKIAGTTGFPAPDANTIYAVFYPDGVSVTLQGATSCSGFGGYHNDYVQSGGGYVTYAVLPRCPPDKHAVGLTVLDQLTATTSHEIIEAATDPLPADKPAYNDLDADDRAWLLLVGGGEIGDVCAAFPGVFYKPTGVDHLSQRVWSNAAAAASHDPCQPNGNSPYFNAAPVLPDTISVALPDGRTVKTKGVKLAIGATKTIELDLFSDAPTSGPWNVTVSDVTSMFGAGSPSLQLALDKSTGQNGDKLQLSITALRASPFGAAPFWIQNELNGVKTVWLGFVTR